MTWSDDYNVGKRTFSTNENNGTELSGIYGGQDPGMGLVLVSESLILSVALRAFWALARPPIS